MRPKQTYMCRFPGLCSHVPFHRLQDRNRHETMAHHMKNGNPPRRTRARPDPGKSIGLRGNPAGPQPVTLPAARDKSAAGIRMILARLAAERGVLEAALHILEREP